MTMASDMQDQGVKKEVNDDSLGLESEARELLPLGDEVTVYSPNSDIRSPFAMLAGIFGGFIAGRELAWRLFVRNINSLYRQTLLGLFWAFLPPIANTAMWIFLKSTGAFTMEGTEVDATVYILTGMILWQAFIDAFQMPLNCLNKNKNMLRKLRFPRE